MITAVCLNPSLDKTIRLSRLVPGGTNRALGESSVPGGKGVNVAFTLAALGLRVRLAGFLNETGGELIKKAALEKKVDCAFVPLPGALRTNLKVLDEEKSEITEINASGTPVTEEQIGRMADMILETAKDSRFLVLTGSMPPNCPKDFYARIIARAAAEAPDCLVALDAEGEAFRLGVREKPAFVKPNRHELSLYVGRELPDEKAVCEAAQELLRSGVGAVMVSMDKDGSMYFEDGRAFKAPAVKVPVVTTVGAGDAMVSAYLAARAQNLTGGEAYRHAIAGATARVAGEDGEAEKYLSMVKIHQI